MRAEGERRVVGGFGRSFLKITLFIKSLIFFRSFDLEAENTGKIDALPQKRLHNRRQKIVNDQNNKLFKGGISLISNAG